MGCVLPSASVMVGLDKKIWPKSIMYRFYISHSVYLIRVYFCCLHSKSNYRYIAIATDMLQDQVGILIDQLLHCVLYEFVKGIELLSNETFFIEKGGNDDPTVFLAVSIRAGGIH